MMIIEIEEIEEQIKLLKVEMIQIAKTTGFNSQDTICCSQKLDKLITIYQKHQQTSYEKSKIVKSNVLFDTSTLDSERTTFAHEDSNIFTKQLFEMPLFNLKQIIQLCLIVLNVPMYPFS